MNKPDRTKIETGTQQSERVGRSREPSISYDENGNRLRPNDLPNDLITQDAIVDAQLKARDQRRDQRSSEDVPSDLRDISADEIGTKIDNSIKH